MNCGARVMLLLPTCARTVFLIKIGGSKNFSNS